MKKIGILTFFAVGCISGSALAGHQGGSTITHGVLNSGEKTSYSFVLEGNKPAIVYVQGEGGDVDCALFDTRGLYMNQDLSPADSCMFELVPSKTERYTLVVGNASKFPEEYVVKTN